MLDFLLDADSVPVTRIAFFVDEATLAQMGGADSGRASPVAAFTYESPGLTGQAWHAPGTLNATYGRLEASLTSSSGPWTNIGTGSLADPSPAGTAKTLWVRYVAHRWSTTVNPSLAFTLGLYVRGKAALDEA